MRVVFSAALLVLAGCDVDSGPANEKVTIQYDREQIKKSAAPSAPSAAAVTSLAGEWRVAGIDGAPFDEPYGLALRGDAGLLWWEPRCAGMVRRYRINGRSIRFDSADAPPPPATSPPVCAIAVPPRLHEIAQVLDRATSVSRTPSNGILISGGGHSLTLFAQ